MNRATKSWSIILPLVICFCIPSLSIAQEILPHDATEAPCRECHMCKSPTPANLCLTGCLIGKKGHVKRSPSEGPDIRILDQIEDTEPPVRFNHKAHAEMVGMGNGCGTCHHYSPVGAYPPCSECHEKTPSNADHLGKPGLNGAYHRQCMGCHREWSHDTKCVVCHVPCEDDDYTEKPLDATDIVGISHPVIAAPTSRIYHTPYEPGPIVTFYHDEHVDLFGFQCVDCHKEENCGYCHDMTHPKELLKTEEEKHDLCIDCHQKRNCGHCHDTKRKPAFNHASTGWPLNQYHNKLDCRACHPTRKKIGKLDSHCNACHGGWNHHNFRHAITGLMLDDNHREWDCADCHPDSKYNKPDCSGCHDDDITPENNIPGKYVVRQ